MQKQYMRTWFDYFLLIVIICMFALFTSCERPPDVSATAVGGAPAGGAGGVGSISLALSQGSVLSDGSDSTTITAAVMDTNNVPMDGAQVVFATTAGSISAASATTDSSGQCQIMFSAGLEKTNQTVTITATVGGLAPSQIPVQITGSTLNLSTSTTNLELGGAPGTDTATLTIRPLDAGSNPIPNVAVVLSVDPASTGTVITAPRPPYTVYTTDINGVLEVDVTATSAGNVTLLVDAAGATAAQAYTISPTGTVFAITAPTQNPYSLHTNTTLTVTVNAPPGVTNVLFAATSGTWDGPVDSVVVKPVAGGTVSADFISSVAAVSTVEVYDVNNPMLKDTMQIVVTAPASEADQLSLQASNTVVAPSTGGVVNTVTLIATVRNASDQVVGDAPVAFSILTPTGGGETISPVIVYTDSTGRSTSTFSSGSLSSPAEGVTVKATVVGSMPEISDTQAIVIGGTAASLVIGTATTVQSINNDTAYKLAMSVLVSDSNGNPMANTPVSLKVWPTEYATGDWVNNVCTHTGQFLNEDLNENVILDPAEDLNGDGQLTPPSSAAGTVFASVSTDDNGVAEFYLIYLKESACWIKDKVTASTIVLGSETQSSYEFWLGWAVGDEPNLSPSPYNP